MALLIDEQTSGTEIVSKPPVGGYLGDVDMDGVVTEKDAVLIARACAGQAYLSPEQLRRADVNGDGKVTVGDALEISNYLTGLRDGIFGTFGAEALEKTGDKTPAPPPRMPVAPIVPPLPPAPPRPVPPPIPIKPGPPPVRVEAPVPPTAAFPLLALVGIAGVLLLAFTVKGD